MDEQAKVKIKNIINKMMMYSMIFLREVTRSAFTFNGKKYKYFYHMYHLTFKNERSVEIPIAYEFVKNCDGRILEVGNTFSYYFNIYDFTWNYDIVDKYDKDEENNVINKDIVDFKTRHRYALIFSISTFEHIGMDESADNELNKLDKTKTIHIIRKFKSLLAKDGKAVITFPLGYNKYLDRLLKNGKIHFNKIYYMKRISRDNKWMQTEFENVKDSKFNEPYKFANALAIGVIEK